MNYDPDIAKKVEDLTKEVHLLIEKKGQNVFKRYPIGIGFITLFGFVLVTYGFQKIADEIVFINKYPLLLIFAGLCCLLLTGSLYKHLNR